MKGVTASPDIALLGDSIFDNAAYTSGEPDVVTHLNSMLPAGRRAALLAVDGARIAGLHSQLRAVPRTAKHIVISVGGNDALDNSDLLATRVPSTTVALTLFASRVARFEAAYRAAIARALELKRHTTVCTIYNGNLDKSQAEVARIALTTFNDVILRVAAENRLAVIELRLVCDRASDYANPIEPSGSGGRKIAAAIVRALDAPSGAQYASVIA